MANFRCLPIEKRRFRGIKYVLRTCKSENSRKQRHAFNCVIRINVPSDFAFIVCSRVTPVVLDEGARYEKPCRRFAGRYRVTRLSATNKTPRRQSVRVVPVGREGRPPEDGAGCDVTRVRCGAGLRGLRNQRDAAARIVVARHTEQHSRRNGRRTTDTVRNARTLTCVSKRGTTRGRAAAANAFPFSATRIRRSRGPSSK